MTNDATFILSTGRCGTQWLAKHLQAVYGDLMTVRHEPIFLHYQPRAMLGHGDPRRLVGAERFLTHMETLERCLDHLPYIECGWPNYGAMPFLQEHFAGRVKIIHLTRQPDATVRSLLSHRWYQRPPAVKEIPVYGELTPFDTGVAFPDYQTRWVGLSAAEKCLYFWGEVNALGLRLEAPDDAPWLRLSYESLFAGTDLERLIDFLNLPKRDAIFAALKERHDKVQAGAPGPTQTIDWGSHPQILEVARHLGYDVEAGGTEHGIAADTARNAPCPCGSGKRFKHCHGRLA